MITADEHYYKKVLPFFSEENTNWLLGDTIATEEHLEFTLPSGAKFQGHLDRVCNNEGLEIRDYKISKRFTRNNIKEKARQLYVYAYGYHQKHGVYPERLVFEFFQDWKKPYIVKFNKKEMDSVIQWVEDRIKELIGRVTTVERLGLKGLFLPNYKELIEEKNGMRNMFCKNVCGYRKSCPFVDGNYLKMFKTPDIQEIEIN